MRFDRRCLLMALAALLLWHPARADEWGHKLAGMPTQFVFGYGSLIDAESREKTAGAKLDAIAVRVSSDFGYLRAWVDRCACGFTALGLRKPHPGEKPMTINGVIYPVEGSNLPAFDMRESGYRRLRVPRSMVEAISWQGLPETGEIWVYVPTGANGEPGEDLPEPSVKFPVLQSYVDLVLHGALFYGKDFAGEIIETTTDWSNFWLNDRESPRRPWMRSNDYQPIDALLSKVSPASGHFEHRLFPEEFTARYQAALAQPNN